MLVRKVLALNVQSVCAFPKRWSLGGQIDYDDSISTFPRRYCGGERCQLTFSTATISAWNCRNGQNGDRCCVFGATDIGWYYTASKTYELTQIETIFDTLGTSGTAITIGLVHRSSRRPRSFDRKCDLQRNRRNATGGTDIPAIPIAITTGTTYFVGLSGVLGVGVNQVTFESTGVEGPPPGSVSPGNTYQDTDGLAQFRDAGLQ